MTAAGESSSSSAGGASLDAASASTSTLPTTTNGTTTTSHDATHSGDEDGWTPLSSMSDAEVRAELTRVRDMAEIDAETTAVVKKVIFGVETENKPALPMLDAYQAGVLVEVMKDLLYQAYVRKGRLQQAMAMRRYFVDEQEGKVTPISSTKAKA